MILAEFVKEACGQIDLTPEALQQAAARFEAAMREGLAGRPSSLRMLPSYITRPTGGERGEAIAVDFGGTNVRILRVYLDGGQVQCSKSSRFNLKDPDGAYDFTREETRAEELFDFIAQARAGGAGGRSLHAAARAHILLPLPAGGHQPGGPDPMDQGDQDQRG